MIKTHTYYTYQLISTYVQRRTYIHSYAIETFGFYPKIKKYISNNCIKIYSLGFSTDTQRRVMYDFFFFVFTYVL